MRRTLVAIIAAVLVATIVQPAQAAKPKKPGTVGLVSFVKADYSRSTNRASMTLDWANARRATKYEVFMSQSYSMKKAKKFTVRSSKIRVKNLIRGRDYFFQVRAVNGSRKGTKSSRVGHPTIVRPGATGRTLNVRVVTYNVCSDVCDKDGTARYTWLPKRQAAAHERILASGADVVATQEAGKLATPAGYSLAVDVSAKRLFYKTSRFDLATTTVPRPAEPPRDKNNCRPTYEWGQPTGHVFLGRHSKGCRYAVWAELVDKSTKRSVLFVNVHTVSGASKGAIANRLAEMNTLMANIKQTNTKKLPVVFAGDFNSHRNFSPDVVRSVMKQNKFYDSFDLARSLTRQHHNSFNAFTMAPRIGVKWGDHLDHVWVNPWTTRVDRWQNIALLRPNGRHTLPIPSDHDPIMVDLRIG